MIVNVGEVFADTDPGVEFETLSTGGLVGLESIGQKNHVVLLGEEH